MADIQEMIDKIDTLQPIPPVANQILALAEKPDISLSELGDIIVVDPAISANMLKICNSAYFGLTSHVDSIHQAVTLLGIDQIVELVILNYVADNFTQEQNGYCLAEGDLWKQSVATAFTANSIAAEKGVKQIPFLFTATLLKDIGKVIMGNFVNNVSAEIKYLILKESLSFQEAEKAIFNIDHAELGGMIATKWNFSPKMASIISYHHEPHKASEVEYEASIVHLTDVISIIAMPYTGTDGLAYRFYDEVLDVLDYTSEDMDAQMATYKKNFRKAETLLDMA